MARKLRIAIFTDGYDPQVNGVVTSIKNLKAELEKRGHVVWVFHPDAGFRRRKHYALPSMPVPFYKDWPMAIPFGFFLKYLFKPPRVDMKRFDVIHVHSPVGAGIDGILLSKMLNIPSVSTYHTFFPKYVKYFFPWLGRGLREKAEDLADKLLNAFHSQADAIIAPSEGVMKYLRRKKVKKPIFIVPSGIKVPRYRDRKKLRKKLGWSGKKILLHVARLSPEKNIPLILKMMKLIENERDDVWLYITSTGPDHERLVRMSKRLGLKHVVFTGYVPERKLSEFYAAADVFVFASSTETQGMVLMEAAMNGLPIVAANVPVVADFVRQYGGLVSRVDPRDMKEKVCTLLNNRRLWKQISEGYKKVRKDYSRKRCVEDMIKVYNLVIEIKKQQIAGKRVAK